MGGRWQAVLKPQGPQVAQILDISLGLGDRKQYSRPCGIQLAVGTHRDVVIVGHSEFEFDLCDLVLGTACAVDKNLVVEGVEEPDLFTAVGLQPSPRWDAALQYGFEANILAPVDEAAFIGDDDVRGAGEERGSAGAVRGRFVAEDDLNRGNGHGILIFRQPSFEQARHWSLVDFRVRLMGVDPVYAQGHEIADRGRKPSTEKGRGIGAPVVPVKGQPRATNSRENQRLLVLIRRHVELDSVHLDFAQNQRRKGRPQIVGRCQRVVRTSFCIGGDHDLAEPPFESIPFEEPVAELFGRVLLRVVDEPSLGYGIAEHVVEVVALNVGGDVAIKVSAGVVGRLPLPPPVFGEQLLGHVPLSHRWINRVERYLHSLGQKARLVPPLRS